MEGILKQDVSKTTWVLSRRRFCIDNSGVRFCVIEEKQNGHCLIRHPSDTSKFGVIDNPICGHEKSFENCEISIVS